MKWCGVEAPGILLICQNAFYVHSGYLYRLISTAISTFSRHLAAEVDTTWKLSGGHLFPELRNCATNVILPCYIL